MTNRNSLIAGVLALLFSVDAIQSAHGQDAGEAPLRQNTLEEIVVTAQKRAENIQDVPIAVSVATGEQMLRDHVYALSDLIRTTASMELNAVAGGQTNGGARIRGLGTNTPALQTNALGSVAIVVDDVPNGNVSFPQLFDLEQVEILRGPQGTLFGSTASAGVINVTTIEPNMDKVSGYFGGQISSKDMAGSEIGKPMLRAAVNLPINDHSAVRLAAKSVRLKGMQRNMWLNKDDEDTTTSFRAYYLNNVTDKVSLRLIAEHHHVDRNAYMFYAPVIPPTNPDSLAAWDACGVTITPKGEEYCSEVQPSQDIENNGISAIIDWDFDAFSFKSITAYRNNDYTLKFRLNQGQVGEVLGTSQHYVQSGDQVSQEFRITSTDDSQLSYVAGIYYFDFNTDTEPTIDAPFDSVDPTMQIGTGLCRLSGTPCPGNRFTKLDDNLKSWSVYGDLTYEISDKFRVFGGLRYTSHDVHSGFGRETNVPTNYQSISDTNVSGRLGVSWFPTENTMYYVSIARGYKAGFVEVSEDPTIPSKVLKPEEPTALEIGVKTSVFDGRFSFDADIFYTDWSNYHTRYSVFSETTGSLITVSANIEGLKGKGLEAELTGNLTDNLFLKAGYIYSDLPYPNDYLGSDGLSLTGKQLLYAPKHKFVISGQYIRQLRNRWEAVIAVSGAWKSDVLYREISDPNYVYPAHEMIGASFGLRSLDGSWDFSVYGQNLTAEREPTSMLGMGFRGSQDGSVRAWPNPAVNRREVGVALAYNF